jgi:xanthosine utilization system XapX-like protein
MTSPRTATAFLLPALLAAAAVALAGLAGVLLGFTALALALDRLLDRTATGASVIDAEQTFGALARRRRRAALARRLSRRPACDELTYLPVDAGWAAVAQRRRLGVQAIAIDSIVGTVDHRKAAAFDRSFRPPAWSRGRWTQMCLAARRGTPLPPIAVYRAGREHFVRDGHHRVSVARALGAASIDADVVELR